MSGFDPEKSKVSAAALARFLTDKVNEDLKSVPGIGDVAVAKLSVEKDGDSAVETTYQLIGKFLALKGAGMEPKDHMDAFWFYLQARGVDSHRSGIVLSIAQKVDLMMPGIAGDI
ncbi:hypothetical protein BASA81_001742 [Batrachochytrium salamandrivorans]|nr:hypothetical protein BASA81_001742 [Batrachochytrium salamandrivorans]